MIGCIAEELLRLSIEYGFDNLPEVWKDGKVTEETQKRYATFFSPTLFARALDQYLIQNKIKIRLDSLATFPVMENDHCVGVVVESLEGREFFGAKVVSDATGDASILQRVRVATALGDNFVT